MNWDYPYSTSYVKPENNILLRLDVERTQNDVAKLTSVVEDLGELAQKERNNISELHSRVCADRADIEALEMRCGNNESRLDRDTMSLGNQIERLGGRLTTIETSLYSGSGWASRLYKQITELETSSALMRKELDDMQTVVHEIDEIGSEDVQLDKEDCKQLMKMRAVWYETITQDEYKPKMLLLVDQLMRDLDWARIKKDAAEG